MLQLNRRGQSTAEYAVLIGVIIGAVVLMGTFVGRRVKGLEYGASRSVQIPGVEVPVQYEPYYAQSNFTTTQSQNQSETYTGGDVTRTGATSVTRTGTETEGGSSSMSQDDAWISAQ